MDNQMFAPYPVEHATMIESMYPECCTRIHPCVKMVVDSMSEERIYNMSPEEFNSIAEDVMLRCNIHSSMPLGHNVHTMTDITKSMLIKEMHERLKNSGMADSDGSIPAFAPFAPFLPYMFYPYHDGYYRREGYYRPYPHWGHRR